MDLRRILFLELSLLFSFSMLGRETRPGNLLVKKRSVCTTMTEVGNDEVVSPYRLSVLAAATEHCTVRSHSSCR